MPLAPLGSRLNEEGVTIYPGPALHLSSITIGADSRDVVQRSRPDVKSAHAQIEFSPIIQKVALLFKILSRMISTGLVRLVHDNPVDPAMNIISPVYTRPLTRIPMRIKLIRVRVNALIRIAIRIT